MPRLVSCCAGRLLLALMFASVGVSAAPAAEPALHSFSTTRLTEHFWSEGACSGDFDRDGHRDIASGPYWYAGPDFLRRTEYYPATAAFEMKKTNGQALLVSGFVGNLATTNGYSNNFLSFAYDFNKDGWDDILVIGFPGEPALWYENPQGKVRHWASHIIFDVLDNESPGFLDITGDGVPELVGGTTDTSLPEGQRGFLGYVTLNSQDCTAKGTFHKISPAGHWQRYTHGMGVGDINGDGRADYLEAGGWWEQPADLTNNPVWKHHPVAFGSGGAQMHVYDVDGDSLNDVVTSIEAHGYGLKWFQQQRIGDEISFVDRTIIGRGPNENRYGLMITQMHAIDVADVDQDGLTDIITGKRYWAHGPGADADPDSAAVIYWLKLVRHNDGQVSFIPQLIDDDSGVGTQVTATDVNGDGLVDVIVGNKKGLFFHAHHRQSATPEEIQKSLPPVQFPDVQP